MTPLMMIYCSYLSLDLNLPLYVNISRRRKVRRLVEKRFYQEGKSNPNFLLALSNPPVIFTTLSLNESLVYHKATGCWVLQQTSRAIDFLGQGCPIIFPPVCGLECPASNFLNWLKKPHVNFLFMPFILRNVLFTEFNLGKRHLVSWNLNREVVSSASWSVYRTVH